MGSLFSDSRKTIRLDENETLNAKKLAEVDSYLQISNQFTGGAPNRNELNFLSLLSESSSVSGDAALEIWGCILGPGNTWAKPGVSLAEFKGNVLIGFLPYKGPTEKARMVMAFKQDQWLDCRVWSSWADFKHANAGAAGVPTGCLPLIWDDNLKTPSGACHRISEWVAVDYYAAAKYSMMGQSAAELASILILREAAGNDFGPLIETKDFNMFAMSEAALHSNVRSELLVNDSVTLADIILFNALSHSYGNHCWRNKFGCVFAACFPNLTSFYHMMLTQHPHLREYIFSPVHTPAIYFMPWTLQLPNNYTYSAADKEEPVLSRGKLSANPTSNDDTAIRNIMSKAIQTSESLFPLVRDEHLKFDFSVIYFPDALADSNKIKDDLLWEFLQLVCKDMGVTEVKEHAESSPPADGPLISWCRKWEVFIPHVYVAACKGKFPLNRASEGAKILQILSTVRQLIQTWMQDVESFKANACDKRKAGDMFTNVSPGNVAFLESLLCLSEWKVGDALVGEEESVADMYVFRFMELVDARLLKSGNGLLSWASWNEQFPLLCKFYIGKK